MLTPVTLNIVLAVSLVIAILIGSVVTLRTRRSLTRVRARFVSVLDGVGFGVLLLNEDGTVQHANSVAGALLRRPETEIVGKHFHRLLHEEVAIDQPGMPCAFDTTVRGLQPYRGQEQFGDGHGKTIPVTVTGTPIGSERRQMVLTFRDRSSDIVQGRQREEAFALVSHEIRSPLTAVVGYSARLRAAVASGSLQVDQQRADEIALLAREANRMREVILLILGMAEVERGRVEVDIEPIRVTQVVKTEVDRLKLDRPHARFAVDTEDVVVESDERYIRLIVQNLLENAAKYGGDAGPIEVSLTSEEDGGCRITVQDHGDGIPLEAQPHIFDRFYRHTSAASRGSGMGLGLYLARSLAVRLGGHLTFTSTPGAGATFVLTLPAVCPDVAPPMPGPAPIGNPLMPGPTQN